MLCSKSRGNNGEFSPKSCVRRFDRLATVIVAGRRESRLPAKTIPDRRVIMSKEINQESRGHPMFFEKLTIREERPVVFVEIAAPPMNLLGPELVRDFRIVERG